MASFLLLVLAFASVGQAFQCYSMRMAFDGPYANIWRPALRGCDFKLCCVYHQDSVSSFPDIAFSCPISKWQTEGKLRVGCFIQSRRAEPYCCCAEDACNTPNTSLVHRQIINHPTTCYKSSKSISPKCGHPDKDNIFVSEEFPCRQEEFACAIELQPDGETGNFRVEYKCTEFCEQEGCKEKDGRTYCCCVGHRCNDKQLALEGFNKQCVWHRCLHGPNNSPQIVSSLCVDHHQLDAGVSAKCQPDEFACAIEVQPQGDDSLNVVYSCAKDCVDNYGCKEVDGKTHCCCQEENCNTNIHLGKEAFDHQCRPQRCPQGAQQVECGQEVRAPEWTPCKDQLYLSCSAEVHVESEGTAMTWRCLEKCTGDGCGWEGDVYRCCCSGHTCNSTWMAQLPLDAHCNRTRCIGSIQSDLCSNSHHLISPKEQLLCSSGQEGCGLHIQMDGGSPQLKYSCVSECGKDECQWMGHKYVCCCIGHNCNHQQMAFNTFKSFCDGPPTKGQQQTTGFGVALICTVFSLYQALANGIV